MEAVTRHQEKAICVLNEENQFFKARLLSLENALIRVTHIDQENKEENVSLVNEPTMSRVGEQFSNLKKAVRASTLLEFSFLRNKTKSH